MGSKIDEIRQRTEAGGPIRRIDMKYLLSEVDRLNALHKREIIVTGEYAQRVIDLTARLKGARTMVEFFTATKPTARKQHICDLCGRPINVGEKYSRFEGKAEGEMFCTKNHLLCADVIARYCQWVGENEYDIDSVNEWAEEVGCGSCQHSHWADDDCGKSFWDCEIARKALEANDGQH